MAMFLASQPYFWRDFDCKVFDARVGSNWAEVLHWMAAQDADYYLFAQSDVCIDPSLAQRLVSRAADVVVPPVYEQFNGTMKLNIKIDGATPEQHKTCGFQICEDSTLSVVCVSRRVLSSLLMASEWLNDETLMAPIKALGFPVYIDWTVEPGFKWADEFRANGNQMLNAYGIWYTRVKRGLPV